MLQTNGSEDNAPARDKRKPGQLRKWTSDDIAAAARVSPSALNAIALGRVSLQMRDVLTAGTDTVNREVPNTSEE